ncbi:arginine kinase-like [Agrilus planipennis]|uniref:arginine kinase n=1 Tax=Agrilus planipennis TaxID=224129 RepID=A0A1W4WKY6_AGRPL|nr:arginine kinase-like [Agrilus planipennis]
MSLNFSFRQIRLLLPMSMASSKGCACGTQCKSKDDEVDGETLKTLEAQYDALMKSNSKSLLRKYLTRRTFDKLKTKKTGSGSTLLDCIKSGLENHDSGVGVYAPDAEAYTVFGDLFDKIICHYHGFDRTQRHPNQDWGNIGCIGDLDPEMKYVASTRVRCGRSLAGYPFNPLLTEQQYLEMEKKCSTVLKSLPGEFQGEYYPLDGMTKDIQQQLIDDHFLFKEGDRFLQSANACRFWPKGRGIFHNADKTFLVWVNEEDHLRIISMQPGGNLGEVYTRFVNGVCEIGRKITFARSEKFGYLTFCPTNLGTAIRASVHIQLPKLASNKDELEKVAAQYSLQVRGTRGEHTEAEEGLYDISNKRRLGLTEFEAIKEMHDGIKALIDKEEKL